MQFPENYVTHRYSLIHFNFFLQYARVAPIEIELVPPSDTVWLSDNELTFSVLVNDQQIIVDYADHWDRNWKKNYPDLPYFKFQTTDQSHPDAIPLGPPMVGVKKKGTKGATLREYNSLKWDYDYQPGETVMCKQLPNGAATERRIAVHTMLRKEFCDVDIDANVDQMTFWRMHENCLASVCVPGATNNMVDRGQIELMGLGVCTISPRLDTIFPYRKTLVPNEHYIQCAEDYSDLREIIWQLQKDPSRCKEIGDQAKKFYHDYYQPKRYWQWIWDNINGGKDDQIDY